MLDALPPDILMDILARFPWQTLLQYRCVCKTFSSIITSPTFVTHHLTKIHSTTDDADLVLLQSYASGRCLLYRRRELHGYCSPKEVDFFPFNKGLYSDTTVVGAGNGIVCLSNVCYDHQTGFYTHTAALWNPIIRRTLILPQPNVILKSGHDRYFMDEVALGFGFLTTGNDYKLVRVAYLESEGFVSEPFSPSVEVYSLKSRLWRMVRNDVRCVIRKDSSSSSVFVNGACHWLAINPQHSALGVIVFFNLEDEVFGEMETPNCLAPKDDIYLAVGVYDGLLSVIALWKQYHWQGQLPIWAMKEYGDTRSWIKVFDLDQYHYYYYDEPVERFVAFRRNRESGDQVLVAEKLWFKATHHEKIQHYGGDTTLVWFSTRSFSYDFFTMSLVLLDEPSCASADKVVSREEKNIGASKKIASSSSSSSSVNDGLDHKRKKNKTNKGIKKNIIVAYAMNDVEYCLTNELTDDDRDDVENVADEFMDHVEHLADELIDMTYKQKSKRLLGKTK